MRLHCVAAVYGLWLVAIFGVFYLVHGKDENALQVILLCGAIPAVCQILLLEIDWRGLVAPMKIWAALIFVILLSYLLNMTDPRTAPSGDGFSIPAAWTPIVYTINTVLIMGIATLVAACSDRTLLRAIAGYYCIFGTPFLVYVDLTGEMLWGRLVANDLQPNNWGLMGFTVCLGALARKRGLVSIAGFAVGTATILQASSREHMLALVAVLLVIAALHLKAMGPSRLVVVLGGACVALIMAALLLDPYILDAISYLYSDILMLDTTDRGLNSGFTGRFDIWQATVDLWLKSPLLGIGFRQHEQFLAGVPAHNAYLAMLADTGLLGFVLYVVLLINSLAASLGIQDPRTRRVVLAAILGYIILGFFDRRTINAGNPYGVLVLMCCAVALVDQSLRKAAEIYRAPRGAVREAIVTTDRPRPA